MSGSIEITKETTVVQVNAPTHMPTKLTTTNFNVWRTQVRSALIGLGVIGYIEKSIKVPVQFLENKVPNPLYTIWNRQDQIIVNAMLGSCHETIQPLISTAATADEMWERLVTLYANNSRSRIISLKSHLIHNTCGSRPIEEYLQDMKSTADELSLVGQSISDDDLVLHTLAGLGEGYKELAAAIKVRESPMSFAELHEKVIDHERGLKKNTTEPTVVTANNVQRHEYGRQSYNHNARGRSLYKPNNQGQRNNSQGTRSYNNSFSRTNWTSRPQSGPKSTTYCSFCDLYTHGTKECRKLSRFLKDNDIAVVNPVANATNFAPQASQQWLFDTGASHHVTPNPANLHQYSEYGGPDEVHVGNGSGLPITHTGTSKLNTGTHSFALKNVLCVPSINKNLISVSKFCATNEVSVEFFPLQFLVKDLSTGAILMRGENQNDVYYATSTISPNLSVTLKTQIEEWHHRLGHPSFSILRSFLLANKIMSNVPVDYKLHCNACACNKSHKLPFGASSLTSTQPLQLIYTDVWGPTISSIDGFRFYVIFVDHYTKYIWLYPIKQKSDVKSIFQNFKLVVEKFFQLPIISVYSDNGGEFQALIQIFSSFGISHFTTPPHTPEHNGQAERRHRHVVETGLTLLHHASMPLTFWSHAFQAAVYLINRMP